MKNHIIYGLINSLDQNVFYIGMTTDIKTRFSKHKGTVKCNEMSNPLKFNYMNEMMLNGGECYMIIFESEIPNKLLAVEREKYYIAKYKSLGHTLTNMNDGGGSQNLGKKLNHGKKILESTPLKKMVYQYDNNKVLVSQFISVREAGRQTGIDHRSIAEVANKSNPKRHRAGGYFWEYNII
jgi:predicted GIY-YIG superfamily endonuclease